MRDVPSILRRNAIPELDFSGTVVRAGPSASSKFPVDTPVFGSVPPSASVLSGVGTMAEYLVVPSSSVAIKPAKISFAEAAGLSSLGQVALEMVHRAHVKSGDLVLVNGGSGGVGSVVVQAAKAAGAEVVATCSEANVNIVRELGADEVSLTRFHRVTREERESDITGHRLPCQLTATILSRQIIRRPTFRCHSRHSRLAGPI